MNPNKFRKAQLTIIALVSSAQVHANSSEQSRLLNLKIHDDLLPHVVVLKDFVTKIDLEDDFSTNIDFVKLLSYLEK